MGIYDKSLDYPKRNFIVGQCPMVYNLGIVAYDKI